jgi:hypothetical protein
MSEANAADTRPTAAARRRRGGGALIGLLASLLAIGGVVALIAVLNNRDEPGVAHVTGPGRAAKDLGHRHLRPGESAGVRFSSNPPTSGPHVPAKVTRDGFPLSNDQLLQALEVGNVVLAYAPGAAPAPLRSLAQEVAGPFSAGLAAGGQAVILMPRAGVTGVVALAWGHLKRGASPQDPGLREFAEFWLGRGAP